MADLDIKYDLGINTYILDWPRHQYWPWDKHIHFKLTMTSVLTLYLRIHSIRVLHHSVHSWSESAANWNTLLVVCRLNLNLSLSLSCKETCRVKLYQQASFKFVFKKTSKKCIWTNSLINHLISGLVTIK